jgi:hypothetical protein
LGCGRDVSPAGTDRTYAFETSSVVSVVGEDADCGLVVLPSSEYDATFVVHRGSDAQLSITERVSRCTFDATADGAVFRAENVECALARDSPARKLGLYREVFDEFVLDTELGTLHSTVQHWQNVNAGSGHSCAVAEGRLLGSQPAHHYATSYRFFEERSPESTDCGRARVYGTTSGYLQVSSLDGGGSSLHWEGFGCDVTVAGPVEGPWTASPQPCVMGESSVAPFGISAIELEALDYDPQTEAFTGKGTMTRADGGAVFCFEISEP